MAGPSRAVLQGVVRGLIQPVISPALETEYLQVLSRQQFVERHGMDRAELSRFLSRLLVRAVIDYPRPSRFRAPDPGDQMIWDLLYALDASVLVTGEKRLVEASDFQSRVFSPRQFVQRFLTET